MQQIRPMRDAFKQMGAGKHTSVCMLMHIPTRDPSPIPPALSLSLRACVHGCVHAHTCAPTLAHVARMCVRTHICAWGLCVFAWGWVASVLALLNGDDNPLAAVDLAKHEDHLCRPPPIVSMRVCMRACVHACVCVCVRVAHLAGRCCPLGLPSLAIGCLTR